MSYYPSDKIFFHDRKKRTLIIQMTEQSDNGTIKASHYPIVGMVLLPKASKHIKSINRIVKLSKDNIFKYPNDRTSKIFDYWNIKG